MEMTIRSTTRMITVNGIPARVWEGKTAAGVLVMAAVTRVGTSIESDCSEFERDLTEHAAPSAEAIECFPLRMVL